jgi:hypothetical protein
MSWVYGQTAIGLLPSWILSQQAKESVGKLAPEDYSHVLEGVYDVPDNVGQICRHCWGKGYGRGCDSIPDCQHAFAGASVVWTIAGYAKTT